MGAGGGGGEKGRPRDGGPGGQQSPFPISVNKCALSLTVLFMLYNGAGAFFSRPFFSFSPYKSCGSHPYQIVKLEET